MENSNQLPKITVITVTYNTSSTLEATIKSVITQDYLNWEYIIVDGNSSDGTVEVIKNYQQHLANWISEPDKGIYDAMNKGFRLATGDLIYFLNGDDQFYDHSVLSRVAEAYSQQPANILIGKVNVFSTKDDYDYISSARISLARVRRGKKVIHQSMFIERSQFTDPLFSIDYKVSADFDLQCKAMKANLTVRYLDQIFCRYSHEGFSSNLQRSYSDTATIIDRQFGPLWSASYRVEKFIARAGHYILQKTGLLKNYYNWRFSPRS